MSTPMVALASSVEMTWRGSMDSFLPRSRGFGDKQLPKRSWASSSAMVLGRRACLGGEFYPTSNEKSFLSFLGISDSSARITPCGKPRMKDTKGDEQEDDWADQTMHWTRGYDEMSAHGLWTKLKRDVPEEDISKQSLNEKACVETSERNYSGGTNERVPEATRRGQKKWPEKRSRERGHRGQEKRSKKRYRQMMADGKIQKSHFKDREVFSTHVACEGLVRMANNTKKSCWQRNSLVPHGRQEIHEGDRGNASKERKLKGYTDWKGVSRQEELLSDIGPVVLARRMDEKSNRCTEARKASARISEGCT
ncbi:hypothetical protein Acr_10g0004910 [Actinidia rufa]|uniref:Uncharacterized protein n=1 Tax=Actinidia rufa TaxID=165716 RepID=A0A7J0F9J7_9ERIC|nr:hypothetical protein Acr_10g0004910 [Actinidia rufa]